MNEKFTIDQADYQSKQQQEKNTFQVFFVLFTRPPSPSGICGTLPLPLVLLMTTAKKKTLVASLFAGIDVSSSGIAGFTEQQTAFTRAQGAILQGQDFNYAREKFLIHEANISKTVR